MLENIIPVHLNDNLARHKILGSSVFVFSMETIMNLLIFSPSIIVEKLEANLIYVHLKMSKSFFSGSSWHFVSIFGVLLI